MSPPQAFARFSAEVGADETLVQGAGGNTSLKAGEIIWIKASGAWLRDAASKPCFLRLPLSALRSELARKRIDEAAIAALAPAGAKPSIETALHGLMPHNVVAHLHSIRTIAWAVREDAEAQLAKRLEGLNWAFLDYVRPGAPLAEALRRLLEKAAPDIVVLGNHGLIVGAPDVAAARMLVDEVETRLAPRSSVRPATLAAPAMTPPDGFVWSDDPWTSAAAFDARALEIARRGSLYPDHVVFLGRGARVLDSPELAARDDKLLFVRGVGALLSASLTPGARAMAGCLGRVLLQIEPGAPVRYLSAADEAELLGWDQEAYRMQLDRLRD